jgi:hypothetical protein
MNTCGRPQRALRAAALGCLLALAGTGVLAADWQDLSPTQRRALAPLQGAWPQVDDTERAMWLELADRYRSLPPEEQARLQQRMVDWSRMSPAARGQARLQFQEASRWSAADRRERWEAYQSLDPRARQVLAERWKLEAASREQERRRPDADKRTLFEQPRPSPVPPRAATPTAATARTGATTRPLVRSADAPSHQQHGLPKIAAMPSFVDPDTLLPRRGPQGAAVVSRSASSPPKNK